MGKNIKNVPDWCKAIGKQLTSSCIHLEDVIEAIKLDIDMVNEEYAKRKWGKIAKDRRKKK